MQAASMLKVSEASARRAPRLRQHLPLALLLVASLGAQAQDAKVSKEREALRRAQSALRAAQEQQSTLQADKARAETEAAAARQDAASARTRIASTVAQLKAHNAELAALRGQLQAARDAQQQADARAAERERELQQRVAAAEREAAARQTANQSLTRLLERSTQALAEADARNHRLYALGKELIDRQAGRSDLDRVLQRDPVFGLVAVRSEDEAEKLRAALEAQRPR